MENKKNSRIGGERGRVKTDFDMTHLIPSKENKIERDRLIAQIELNKTLKIKALSDRDGDKANMYQYAVQELQSVYHHILQPLSQKLAEKDKEIESYMSLLDDASKTVVEKDKVIERFAIRFAEWISSQNYKNHTSNGWSVVKRGAGSCDVKPTYSTEQLIELYKQSLNM